MAILSHTEHITKFFCSDTGRCLTVVHSESLSLMEEKADKEKDNLGDTDYYITYKTEKRNTLV